jgi:biotin synthase
LQEVNTIIPGMFKQLLNKQEFTCQDIVLMLHSVGQDRQLLFEKAVETKEQYVKNKVYLRGLIEFSNVCLKDCLYCGIRKSNNNIRRFNLTDEQILNAARYAHENKFGSIVLQSGEITNRNFSERIVHLLTKIQELSDNKLRVTLSCGEQGFETYKKWFESGASRYLLRIETSTKELYSRLHPNDELHSFEKRLECISNLKEIGYQVGTGVMIGLPFQTVEDMANDLLWMKRVNIDMVGMGPYLEHKQTPLYEFRHLLLPRKNRFDLSLKMIAILRIMMKNINIAASTALQSIDKMGREKAIKIGANVFMPNITPGKYRDSYQLYDNKPCTNENAEDCNKCIEVRVALTNNEIAYNEWGDSIHYLEKDILS